MKIKKYGFIILCQRLRRVKAVSPAFTIVELLVVIVVIGILAAITIVSYTGLSSKSIYASIQSDLSSSNKRLALFQVSNGAYPETNDCEDAESATNICLKSSGSNVYTYTPLSATSPQAYQLTSTNGTNTATATVGVTLTITSPNGGESWQKTGTYNVTFTVSPAIPSGNFRLQLYDSTGVYYNQWISTPSTALPAVAEQVNYTYSWTITQASIDHWRVRLYYYDTVFGVMTQRFNDISDADFTVSL